MLIKALADLARPFALYVTSAAAGWATVIIAQKVQDGNDGAWALAAIGATLSALYVGKALELSAISKHTAAVEVERAKATPPPAEALKPAPETDDQKPPWERGA